MKPIAARIADFPAGSVDVRGSLSFSGQPELPPPLIKVVAVGVAGRDLLSPFVANGVWGLVDCIHAEILPVDAAESEKMQEIQSAERKLIAAFLGDADIVFVLVSDQDCTGLNASSFIAGVARESGALTIGILAELFEASAQSDASLGDCRAALVVSADAVMHIGDSSCSDVPVTAQSHEGRVQHLCKEIWGVAKGMSEMLAHTGLKGIDFEDVRFALRRKGRVDAGIGYGVGANRGADAVRRAVATPALGTERLESSGDVLAIITASSSLKIGEIAQASTAVLMLAGEGTTVTTGNSFDEGLGNKLRVTLICGGKCDVAAPRVDLGNSANSNPALHEIPAFLRKQHRTND
jgi:cell division protein FtsZ